jgi:hypothetical protein
MTTDLGSVNDFLMGSGVPSAKFETPGTTVTGKIVRTPEVQQQRDINTGSPKFWDDGTPQKQIVVQLQTTLRDPQIPDDDGVRAVYIRGQMLTAVRQAVRSSGAQLETGGTLTITYTGDGEPSKRGYNPPKLYSATYSAGTQAAVNDMLNEPQPAPAAARPMRNLPPGITEELLAGMSTEQRKALSILYPSFPPF